MVRGIGHLSDDRLIEACTTEPLGSREREHLQRCPECATRQSDLVGLLEDVAVAAESEADAAFPPERLARQQARILARVAQDGRPARVISFPGYGHEAGYMPARPAVRWVAGAAAAGLVIGLVAGHMSRDFSVRVRAAVPRLDATSGPMRTVNAAFAEEELLGQIELAVSSSSGSALGALNAMTPRAWEVK